MSRAIWPHNVIRELLALAFACGESSASLKTEREAQLFRYAIYSFRRNNPGIGDDVLVTLDGTKVVLTKRLIPNVVLLQEQEA